MSSKIEIEYYLRMVAIADTALDMLYDNYSKWGYPDWLESLADEYQDLVEEFNEKYEAED